MRCLSFELGGKTAFFKKPDVNSFAYFTYNNIHKVALMGLLGAIIGLEGYNQQKNKNNKKAKEFPEFYQELNNLKISTIPLSEKGYFTKKMQSFNNSVGYASREAGGNLVVREQWLEDPCWKIYLLSDTEDSKKVFDRIQYNLLNNKSAYIPYLGKNDHPAIIENCKIEDVSAVQEPNYINSLFPSEGILLDELEDTCDKKNISVFKEFLPIGLEKKNNYYIYKEMMFTNACIENAKDINNIFNDGKMNICFV